MADPVRCELQLLERHEDFYVSLRRRLVRQLRAWRVGAGWRTGSGGQAGARPHAGLDRLIEALLFLPDLFHISARLVLDPEVPAGRKGALVAGLAYVLSPIDLIPDTVPLFGWIDDLIVMTLALKHFLDPEDELIQAAIQRHWVGDRELLELLQHVLDIGESAIEFLPNRLIKLLKPILKGL
ncbi:MAG TPA: DUF1232 domain-containing protein [Deltaproteobacteria bacterium]|nr:DUF1232 domain-containing protein [Deltaproteobacteria bacterium]